MSYRVGSFNTHKLSRFSDKDYASMAQMIYDAELDVVALQEIFSAGSGVTQNLLPYLKGMGDWTCITSEPVDNTMESYSFLWNKQRLDLVKTEVNGKTRVAQPHIWKQYRREFMPFMRELKREPFYIRLTNEGTERGYGPHFELRLINTHIRYQKDDEIAISGSDQRKEELEALVKGIYPSINDKRYGNFLPAITILLGDYNLSIKASDNKGPFLDEIMTFDDASKVWIVSTIQDKKSTIKNKDDTDNEENEQPSENRFSMNYDHFSFDKNKLPAYINVCERIDSLSDKRLYNGNFDEYLKRISDHVPVFLEIDFKDHLVTGNDNLVNSITNYLV